MLRLLAARPETPGDAAAAALGWTPERWWRAVGVKAEWFDFTAKGWFATPAGLRELEAADGDASR